MLILSLIFTITLISSIPAQGLHTMDKLGRGGFGLRYDIISQYQKVKDLSFAYLNIDKQNR